MTLLLDGFPGRNVFKLLVNSIIRKYVQLGIGVVYLKKYKIFNTATIIRMCFKPFKFVIPNAQASQVILNGFRPMVLWVNSIVKKRKKFKRCPN